MKLLVPRITHSNRREFVSTAVSVLRLTPFRSVVIALSLVFLGSLLTFRVDSHKEERVRGTATAASSAGRKDDALPSSIFARKRPGSRSPATSTSATPLTPVGGTPIFLADAEQIINTSGVVTGGVIDFWKVTLGTSDTFQAGSPGSLVAQPVPGPANSDVDFPNDLLFDPVGDLLVANGGSGSPDFGNFACVPASAVTTGTNDVTVLNSNGNTNTFDDPQFLALGNDSNGTVALTNTSFGSGNTPDLAEFAPVSGVYAADPSHYILHSAFGAAGTHEVVALPSASQPAGTFAVSITDTTQAGTHVVFHHRDGTADQSLPNSPYLTDPFIGYDPANDQIAAADSNGTSSNLTFWSVANRNKVAGPFTFYDDGSGNSQAVPSLIAVSSSGYVAVSYGVSVGPEVQIYDNSSTHAKLKDPANGTTVLDPIGFDATTVAFGSNFVYGGQGAVNISTSMRWITSTKLMITLYSQHQHVKTAANGIYIFDVTQNGQVQSGFDPLGRAYGKGPKQSGFQQLANVPLATSIRPGTFTTATVGSCNSDPNCFPSINSAITSVVNAGGGVVNVLGGTFNEDVVLNSSNVTVNLNADTTVKSFTMSAGTFNGAGGFCGQTGGFNLTLTTGDLNTSGGIFNAGSGTVTLNTGNWINNGGTFNANTGTVVLKGSGAQSIGGTNATTFNNLTINNTSGGVSLASNESVNSALTLTSGTLGVGSHTLTLNGTASKTSGSLTSNADGTVNYNQSSDGQSVLVANYGNLTFSNFKKTLPNSGSVGVAGTFSPGTATGHTITGSTIEYNGTSPQSLPSGFTPYNNLTLNNSSGTTGFAGLTVNGLIEVKAGTFTSSSTYNNVQIDNSATLAGVNATTINVSGSWTNNGTFTANGNTVNFNGASLQSIGGTNGTTFNNLIINNTSGGVGLNSSQTVVGTLTLTGGVFSIGANTLTLDGAISGAGSNLSAATGTVNYNQGSDGQSVLAANYGNLTFSNFKKTLPGSGTVGIAGTFTTGAGGGHTLTGSTVEFNGASAQTLPSTFTTYNNLTLNNSAGTSGFSGLTAQALLHVAKGTFTSDNAAFNNVQIDNANSSTLAGVNNTTINVTGNWTDNGTFTHNSNTINLNGNNNTQTISGSSASPFNNLTSNHIGMGGVALGADAAINGMLTLTSDLDASTFTLTMPAAASSAGAGDVTGNVKRLFPVTLNTALSFGNPSNQITITTGTAPANITVNLLKAAPSDFTGAVKRKYTITPSVGSGFSAKLRLHYNDADLNSNNESFLDLWRFGASWTSQGHTTRDANANWVELSGVTAFSPWTLATHVNQPPSVTGASTFVNVQTGSGLVVTPAAADSDVANFKITNITNGTLYKNDGTTPINAGNFITVAEGAAGLKFTPTTDFSGNGSFDAQSSFDNSGSGLSGATTTTIAVNKYNTSTTINSDNPDPSNQGDNVTVNYSVVNSSGGPTPAGNVVVTVSGGSETCTDTVAAGSCTLALTTVGNPRTITATYAANASFNGSSNTASHAVNACINNPMVTNTNDSGAGSLRDAITNICSSPNNNVTFNIPTVDPHHSGGAYTITLTGGELPISKNVTIAGPNSGADTDAIIVSGNNASRVFNIGTSGVNTNLTVNISNLTVTQGNNSAIVNHDGDTLTLTNMTISNSTALNGGGISNSCNTATCGTVILKNSSVTGNTATGSAGGGGVYVDAGPTTRLFVDNSTFDSNHATAGGGANGGGAIAANQFAQVIVSNSTISNNNTDATGGGISGFTGTIRLINTTISGNTAKGNGGGLYSVNQLVNCTVTNNHADSDDNGGTGGGIYVFNPNTVSLQSTIVAGNFVGSGTSTASDIAGSGGATVTGSFNLVGTDGTGTLTNGNNNQVGVVDAKLAALANNGGTTQTQALLAGSPAIDAGTDVTTLNGNSGGQIDNVTTSVIVADATAIPAGVGFLVQIDSEQMSVASKSSNTLTVVRHANGTAAAAHNDGTAVNPAFDQRGAGFSRLVNTIDIGSFEANYTVSATAGTPQSATINTAFATQLQATITESGNPVIGIPVTFTAPGGATASGTFSGSATVNTNASGVATAPVFTANGLAGGPYNVVASIGSGQPTASFALTNTKANQAITIVTHAPVSAAYNTSFTVAATSNSGLAVTYGSAGACTNVGATFTMTASTGNCTVKYDQAGDSNYNAATELTESVTAQKANQSISVGTHAPASALYNGSFTVAATSTSGLTVAYSSAGACTNVGATFTMTSGTGTCTVKYDQAGDSNYNAAAQVTESVTAQKANQAITIGTHAPASAVYNASVTVAATSTSGLTVAYSSAGACTNVGATFTLTSGTGTCTVKYDQAGNANYNAASQLTETVNAQKANQAITIGTHAPASAAFNGSFTVAATSNSGLAVAHSSSGACTNVGATFTMTSASGTCTVMYDQAGDSNYNGAPQVTESVSAQKAAQTVTVNTHAPATATYNAQFTVAATASSGLPVTYSSAGSCTNSGATFTMTSGTGTCTVKYDQGGNANFNGAPQVTESVTAQKAAQTITVNTHAPTTAAFNSQFTVAATASSGLGVAYSSGGSCTNSGATFTITSSSGTCSVIYNQAGDANNNAAPQVTESVTAQKASQTITVNTHAPGTAAFNASFTVAATASSGLAVTYSSAGSCTNSGATFTITSGTGTCTVKYDQAGNGNFNAAPQVTESVTAQKAVTTTAITSSANPSALGQSVTLTATVSSAAGTPTGTVQFKDGGTNLGALQTLNASGVAQVTTSTLTAGSHTITADYSGDGNFAISTGTLPGGQTVGNQPLISFSTASYSVNESSGFIRIIVNRTGDTTVPVGVDYATDDSGAPVQCTTLNSGLASSRCDFTAAFGRLNFAANDTQKTFDIPINQDSYTEGPEMFTVNLSNLSAGAFFAAPSTATVTINDSPPPPPPNAIDDTSTFVRQQYHDFLNREPDSAGLAFWVNNIDKCNDPANRAPGQTLAQCVEVQRINTSGAFFLSIEFQQTGNLVRSYYVAALNRPATNNMPAFIEFERDTQAMQRGVIVDPNNNSWQAVLAANRDAFMKDFVTRAEFVGLYPTTDSPSTYVTKLYQHALGRGPTPTELQDGVNEFPNGATQATDPGGRGRALLRITQASDFQSREMDRSFVQMEYFGYLRRNPNDSPDSDFTGYNFWLNKLNQFNGDFIKAEMVKAFITSAEYRKRFGTP